MFTGAIPRDLQRIVAEVAGRWRCARLYVGCSGNFTIERILRTLELHSNDVSLYTSALGVFLAGREDWTFAVAGENREEWGEILDPLLATPRDRAAVVLVLSEVMAGLGKSGIYWQRMIEATKRVLPEEAEQARTALQEATKMIPPGERWVARFSEYNGWMDALDEIASSYNVGNVATGVMLLLALFECNKEQLREGYLNAEGETLHAGWVPLASIFGVSKIPARSAARLSKVAERIAGENDLPKGERWKVLDLIAEKMLNG